MLWLIAQIAVFLLVAALIGFVVGWLLRGLWPSSRARAREGELEAALERAGARISDLEAGLRSKRVAANAAAEQEQAARRRVEELEAALANLHSHSDADVDEVARLQQELDEAAGSIDTLRSEMAGLRADAGTVAALTAERDAALARVAELERSAGGEPRQGGLFLVPEPGEPDRDEPDEEALEAARLAAVAEATERFRSDEPLVPDDLKRIHGIGPVLERTLHSMNITTFGQIAGFTEEDVALVSAALGRAFPDRITRDDWIGGARALLSDPGEPS